MDRCWILLGMMGCGKSALSRRVAELSGREFLDTDLLVQNKLCRPISQIFQVYGEAAFREHEHWVLRNLQPGNAVLATGGGVVLREDNWQELRRIGTTVYLEAPLDALLERLACSKKKRPLLQTENWEQTVADLLERRRPLYEQADLRFTVGQGDLDETADRLVATLGAQL